MSASNRLKGVVLDRRATFTLREMSRACCVEETLVIEMVQEGVIEPTGPQSEWRFQGDALVRAQTALRLMRDLGVNWPGAALALDLLERLERAEAARSN